MVAVEKSQVLIGLGDHRLPFGTSDFQLFCRVLESTFLADIFLRVEKKFTKKKG